MELLIIKQITKPFGNIIYGDKQLINLTSDQQDCLDSFIDKNYHDISVHLRERFSEHGYTSCTHHLRPNEAFIYAKNGSGTEVFIVPESYDFFNQLYLSSKGNSEPCSED